MSKLLENWASKYSANQKLNRLEIETILNDTDKGELLAAALARIGRTDCARLLRSTHQTLSRKDTSQVSNQTVETQQS